MAQYSGAASARISLNPGGSAPGSRKEREKAGNTSMRSRETPQEISVARISSLTAITLPKQLVTAQAIFARTGSAESHSGPRPEWKVMIGGRAESFPAAAQAVASIQDFGFAPLVCTWMRKPRIAYRMRCAAVAK